MKRFRQIFPNGKAVVGMVHVGALPGTPLFEGSMEGILEKALLDAQRLKKAGMDGILMENMHDLPYLNSDVGPEITAALTRVCAEVKRATELPAGVQVLAGANEAALAVALAAGLDFIRAEGYVFGHVADEGWMDAQAGKLLRYRKAMGADRIAIFADIKKKHSSHSVTADVDLLQTAQAAAFFLADGVIVTGTSTGVPADLQELGMLHGKLEIPVWVGSGVDLSNADALAPLCDAVIVGSSIKDGGKWQNPVDEARARELASRLHLQWDRQRVG